MNTDEIAYRLLKGGIYLVRKLPYPLVLGMFRGLGSLAWRLDKFHRDEAETQMQAALGELYRPGMSKEVFRFNADILVDTIRYAYMTPDEVRAAIKVKGREHLDAALAEAQSQGRGLLIFTSHISNWELFAHLGTLTGVTPRAMTDPRQLKATERVITEIRTRSEAEPLPPQGGMLKQLSGELRDGRPILILIDNRGSRLNRLFCKLFGLPAQTNPAPAYIGLKGDALMLPAWFEKVDGRYSLNFGQHFDCRASLDGESLPEHYREADVNGPVARLSQQMQDMISAVVPRNPSQWFWLNSRYTRRSNLRRLFARGGDFRTYLKEQQQELQQRS
jgi:lauroyl/myristoyl acyltransferase